MNTSEILFVGVKGRVVAYNKKDGCMIWATQLKSGGFLSASIDFVTVLVEGDRIYAHSQGELFCLDSATGQQIWNNKMEGLGFNIATLAVESPAITAAASPSAAIIAAQIQKRNAANTGANPSHSSC